MDSLGPPRFLEWQPTKSDVEADGRRRPQQEHSILESERHGIGHARLEVFEQCRDEAGLFAEARQQREIDIDGFSRLTPGLDRQTTGETESPAVAFADRLQCGNGLNARVHGRGAFRNTRCCSTRPEVGFGGRGGTR